MSAKTASGSADRVDRPTMDASNTFGKLKKIAFEHLPSVHPVLFHCPAFGARGGKALKRTRDRCLQGVARLVLPGRRSLGAIGPIWAYCLDV